MARHWCSSCVRPAEFEFELDVDVVQNQNSLWSCGDDLPEDPRVADEPLEPEELPTTANLSFLPDELSFMS